MWGENEEIKTEFLNFMENTSSYIILSAGLE